MNNVCLCVGNYAKIPYYLKLSDFYLYSIEELCYYFMERVHLLDDSIVCMELVEWIRTQCGLEELAQQLEPYVRKHVSVFAFVSVILEYTEIYDEEQIRKTERILKEQQGLSVFERHKKMAEYLYRQGRFRQALEIYEGLMEYLPENDTAKRATLLYNMGSVYALDFAYEEALYYYYESYRLKPDKKTRISIIIARRRLLSDYAYGVFRRERPEWEAEFVRAEEILEQVDGEWLESREKRLVDNIMGHEQGSEDYIKSNDELIRTLKLDYIRQTM